MNENAPANVVVHVHVGGKVIAVACGSGMQRVKWLANVGIARTEDSDSQVPMMLRRVEGRSLFWEGPFYAANPHTQLAAIAICTKARHQVIL